VSFAEVLHHADLLQQQQEAGQRPAPSTSSSGSAASGTATPGSPLPAGSAAAGSATSAAAAVASASSAASSKTVLLRHPRVFSLAIVWESPQAPVDALHATIDALGTQLELSQVFGGIAPGPQYQLR
jgi:hypothetical protein